jgi:hypothetical protein
MVWLLGGVVLVYALVALISRLTQAPIMRRRVNTGTDRWRASMDYIAGDDRSSAADIVIGSGTRIDPMAKRLPIPPQPSKDSKELPP